MVRHCSSVMVRTRRWRPSGNSCQTPSRRVAHSFPPSGGSEVSSSPIIDRQFSAPGGRKIGMKNLTLLLTLIFAMTAYVPATAQEHTPGAAAKAEFDKARALPFGDKGAVTLYRKAIDLDPDFYEAHQYYIMSFPSSAASLSADGEKKAARERARKELEDLYQCWAKDHPDKAVYQWALGWLCDYENPDKAVEYYKQAIKIDPKYAPAYDMLGISAEEHGDLELSRDYERKAHESWPNNITFWRHYAGSWVDADLNKARELAMQMAEKFPEEGARMLGYVASRSTDESQTREIYETLRRKFPKAATGYTLVPLFNIYLKTDRPNALMLDDEMLKTK